MGRRITPVNMGGRTVAEPTGAVATRVQEHRGNPKRAAAEGSGPKSRKSPPRHPGTDDPADPLEPLLRNLLDHAVRRAPADPDGDRECDEDGARVLFDVEVDGARYQLLRSEMSPPPGPPPGAGIDGPASHHTVLSPREREIVRMVALGHPNKTIAAVLEISCWTVGTYLRRIFAKLNVGSRAAMVARVMEKDDLAKPAIAREEAPPAHEPPMHTPAFAAARPR